MIEKMGIKMDLPHSPQIETMTPRKRAELQLTEKQRADNAGLFWAILKRLTKDGEPWPYATMMAERSQLQDLNRLLGRYDGPIWLPRGVSHYVATG